MISVPSLQAVADNIVAIESATGRKNQKIAKINQFACVVGHRIPNSCRATIVFAKGNLVETFRWRSKLIIMTSLVFS